MGNNKRNGQDNPIAVAPDTPTVHTPMSLSRQGAAVHDDSETIDIGSGNVRSSNAATENPRRAFKGRPPQPADDVLQVCRVLRTALNDHGDTWGSFSEPSSPATDVDATATDTGGSTLRVHVSRVARVTPRRVARGDRVVGRTVEERAAELRTAVDSIADRQPAVHRSELLLALDAIRSPAHLNREVVDAFIATHGAHVAELGYGSIWLVGPTGEMSRRLC